jgi:hypothetical protein
METNKTKELFIGKFLSITYHKTTNESYFYKGNCIDLTETNIIIHDKKTNKPVILPIAKCKIEVLE